MDRARTNRLKCPHACVRDVPHCGGWSPSGKTIEEGPRPQILLALGLLNVRGSPSIHIHLSDALILTVYFVALTRLTCTLFCCFQFSSLHGVVMNILVLVKSWDLFPELNC